MRTSRGGSGRNTTLTRRVNSESETTKQGGVERRSGCFGRFGAQHFTYEVKVEISGAWVVGIAGFPYSP